VKRGSGGTRPFPFPPAARTGAGEPEGGPRRQGGGGGGGRGSLLQVEDGDPVADGAEEGAAVAGEGEVPAAVDGTQQAGELRGEEEGRLKGPGGGRRGRRPRGGGCRQALTR